jgi:hypothetical protein
VKTQQLPYDDDERAMADLAEVADWRLLWGRPATGPAAVRALADRVSAATGWRPWSVGDAAIDRDQEVWGLVTRRGTVMLALADAVFPDSPRSGWSVYDIEAGDLDEAAAGIDAHWPEHLDVARRHWGEPAFVGRAGDPRIPAKWRHRRHLAVWVRPGAEFHLYAGQPVAESVVGAAGVSYSVYASEAL